MGSHTLANVCASVRYGGVVAACGLAQGMDFPATVAPFILRGVSLLGIDSGYIGFPTRQRVWDRLATDLKPRQLAAVTRTIAFDALPTAFDDFIDGTGLRDEIAQMDKRAEQVRQQLEQSMGDASRALFPTGEITYRRSKDATSVDLKKLAEAHPDLVAQFTVERPGSRRFRIVPNPD